MDEQKLENALNALLETTARTDGRLAAIEGDIVEIKAAMATKSDLAELRHAITHYGKYVEGMLNSFARSALGLEEEVADLRRRVAEIEKRLPPQQAA